MSQIGNSQYYSTIGASQFQSITDQNQLNSIIKNMEGDTIDRPIKFAKPKYLDVQKTYEELDPIRNKTIIMPTKQSNKIRTTEPVFQKPIILGENASISQVFNGNELENQDIPLPTNSVINNLIKDSLIQSQTASYKQEIPEIMKSKNKYQTNYELKIRQSEAEKYKKSMAKQSMNLKTSDIPNPDVYEGQGLQYSSIQNNSSINPQINDGNQQFSTAQSKIKNSNYPNNNNVESIYQTTLMDQQYPPNKSGFPSKINQSNMPQKSIHPNNISQQSNHPSQIQMQQSNMYNKSSRQSNIPPNQSNIHNSSKQSQNPPMNQSSMYQQSHLQSNIPHQSTHPSQIQMQQSNAYNKSSKQSKHSSKIVQSNINNNYNNQSSTKPPLPSYHDSQAQKTSQINNTNNNFNNSIKKSGYPGQSMHQSGLQQSNMYSQANNKSKIPQTSIPNSQINKSLQSNNNIDINDSNISNFNQLKIPSTVYETQMLNSNDNNNMPNNSIKNSNQFNLANKQISSIHVSKESQVQNSGINNNIKDRSITSEYNKRTNSTNLNNNNNISYPGASNMGNNMGKTAIPPNPYEGNLNSMNGSKLPTLDSKIKRSSRRGY